MTAFLSFLAKTLTMMIMHENYLPFLKLHIFWVIQTIQLTNAPSRLCDIMLEEKQTNKHNSGEPVVWSQVLAKILAFFSFRVKGLGVISMCYI